MLTMIDVCDRLKHLDEVTLLEVLDIASEDIVDRFEDLIEDNYEDLAEELADEDYERD
jgi:hypothetical protein